MDYPLTEAEFRTIYAKVPRLCVDLIIRKDNKILLTKRKIDPYKGLWHLPGGTVYFGETIEAAAKRVALGELGLEISIKKLLGYVEFPDETKGDWHGWPVSLDLEVEIISGDLKNSDQADEFNYFDTLPENIVPSHGVFLAEKLGLQKQVVEK